MSHKSYWFSWEEDFQSFVFVFWIRNICISYPMTSVSQNCQGCIKPWI